MSILEHKKQAPDEDRAANVWLPNKRNADIRTYRGKSLEALLPKIRKELGPDAVILREREGLMGGVGGFFATRFVEVEARAGASINVFDEDDDLTVADLALAPAPERVALPAPPPADPGLSGLSELSEFSAKLAEAVEAWSSEGVGQREIERAVPEIPALVLDGPAVANPVSTSQPVPVAVEEPRTTEAPALPAPSAVQAPAPQPAPSAVQAPAPQPALPARRPAASKPTAKVRTKLPRRAAAPQPVDTEAAARVLGELVELGVSDRFARELVGTAAAHGCAVAGGLRAAVRAELARRLAPAAPLPRDGAAVAFVGTGGSGKSMASAALAATYRYGSTLPVSVASLCEGSDQRRLADVLASDGVPVTRIPEPDARTAAVVRRQIATDRHHGLVIIDTPAVSPTDYEALADLSERLEEFTADAVYLVLSATTGAHPARRALTGLAPLAPTAIVISHADETDQVGVAIELAASTGVPVAYLTAGSDHHRSLIGTDPAALAHLLLP